jgi:hypothetical protein
MIQKNVLKNLHFLIQKSIIEMSIKNFIFYFLQIMEKLRQESQKIEGSIGQHINSFAQQLINEAQKRNGVVIGTFNDVDLVVDSNLSVDKIVATFEQEMNRKAEEYRNSPEGIKSAQESEMRKQNMQEKATQLVEDLNTLNFSDYESVLEWICNFQEASDYIGVSYDKSKVISTFKDNAFDIGVNTGKDFNGEDAENFAKYLVGQALDGINTVGAPHQIVHKFTNDWKQKFGKQKQADDNRIEELRKTI